MVECLDTSGEEIDVNYTLERVKSGITGPKSGTKCKVSEVIQSKSGKLKCYQDMGSERTCKNYKIESIPVRPGPSIPGTPTQQADPDSETKPWWFVRNTIIKFITTIADRSSPTKDKNITIGCNDTVREFSPNISLYEIDDDGIISRDRRKYTISDNMNKYDFYLELQNERYLKRGLQKIFDQWHQLINGLNDTVNALKIIDGLKKAEYTITLFDLIEFLNSPEHSIALFIKYLFNPIGKHRNECAEVAQYTALIGIIASLDSITTDEEFVEATARVKQNLRDIDINEGDFIDFYVGYIDRKKRREARELEQDLSRREREVAEVAAVKEGRSKRRGGLKKTKRKNKKNISKKRRTNKKTKKNKRKKNTKRR
jgi:hypothetical protein